jgi:hypothetical protein
LRAVVGLSRAPEAVVILGSVALLSAVIVSGANPKFVGPLVVMTVALAALHRSLLRWHSLIGLIVVIVLFVPIGRYHLPGSLPFNLELYRVAVALVVLIWLTSLLIDRRVTLTATPFDWPILLLVGCILASELTNPGRVQAYGSFVMKTLTFFFSFVLVYYLIATTIRSRDSVLLLLRLLTGGTTVVAALGILELRTGFNVFNKLHSVLPILILDPTGISDIERGGHLRIYGPAQHPIALGGLFALVVPISVYLMKIGGRRWFFATVLLILGALATGSRTALTMLLAEFAVYFIRHRREAIRVLPAFLPAIVVIHIFLPGAIGNFREAFFPKGGLIAEQTQLAANANAQLAGGRIRQLRPMISEASRHPLFGEGMGTRIVGFFVKERNAPILDNQWLNNLLDVGYIGFGLWLWLFVRAVRKLLRRGKELDADDADRWLFDGLAASIVAFGVGMLTFDAFGFTQIFIVFWVLLGLSAALLTEPSWAPSEATAEPAPGSRATNFGKRPSPATH